MKLNVVPPRTGITWVQQGLKTFLRQPLALAGLFFMMWASVFVVSIIPVVGIFAALVYAPTGTLGLMIATEKVTRGVFPMPTSLVEGFRGDRARLRQLLLLGAINAALVIAIVLLVSSFASNEPLAGPATKDQPQLMALTPATIIASLLQLPVAVLFTIAPALVFWHGVPAVKALFFSAVAFGRNLGAWIVFGAFWTGLIVVVMLVVGLLVQLLGGAAATGLVVPVALTLLAALSTSLFFPFRDSFAADPDPAPASPDGDLP
jgi:hypothetical protein